MGPLLVLSATDLYGPAKQLPCADAQPKDVGYSWNAQTKHCVGTSQGQEQERDSRENRHGDGMYITCIGQITRDKRQGERTGRGHRSWGQFQGRMGHGASSRSPSLPSLVLPFPTASFHHRPQGTTSDYQWFFPGSLIMEPVSSFPASSSLLQWRKAWAWRLLPTMCPPLLI